MNTILSYLLLSFILKLCSCVIAPIGVPPWKAHLYPPNKDFTCFDGSLTIPFSYVNDDYCDCLDNSDEPGTSACPVGRFFCLNEGYFSGYIPSPFVNDGICDCCDGSDEYLLKNCEDVCEIMGAEARAEAERQAEMVNLGNNLRQEMITKGKQSRQQKQTKLAELEKDKTEAEELVAVMREMKEDAESKENAALEVYRKLEDEVRQAQFEKERQDAIQEAHNAFKILDTNEDMKLQTEEVIAQMKASPAYQNKDDVALTEEAKFLMDQKLEIPWEEFQESVWSKLKPLFVAKGQYIPSGGDDVEEEETGKGEAIPVDFPTQEEQESRGEENEEEEEIEEGEAHGEVGPDVQEESPIKYDEETQKLIADSTKKREHFDEANRDLKDIEQEINKLREYLEKDFGKDDEFSVLEGECFTFTDREYIYKLCPFDQVIQSNKHGGSETRLGVWKGWENPDDYSTMLFDKGQTCWNGPQRSTKVHVSCGLTNEVVSAAEPNKCEYVLQFKTPAACKAAPSTTGHMHDEL